MEKNRNFLARKPSSVLGITLKDDEKIWLYLLLPPCGRCVAYMFDFASNVAVVYQHFKNGYVLWGALSLFLMYLPPLVHYVIIISTLKLWKKQEGIWNKLYWPIKRFAQLIFFPGWVMHRFSNKFFWAAEAMMRLDNERENAIMMASQPNDIELYLFLQPFLQCIPQSFLQLYIMLHQYKLDKNTSHLQVLCIITSITMVAMTTASFLWFESQKIAGRREPWHSKNQSSQNNLNIKSSIHHEENTEPTTPFLQPRMVHLLTKPTLPPKPPHLRSSFPSSSNEHTESEIAVPTSPAPPRPASVMAPEVHRTINKRSFSFPLYLFSSNESDSIQKASKSIDANTLALPQRREQFDGREEDDPLGGFVAFLWWWFFVISRIVSLAASAHFQPYLTLAIILVHYIIMLSFLLRKNRCPSIYEVFIQFCMAYVLLFCFMEFRIKLKSIIWFYTGFMVLIILENSVMSILWYTLNDSDGFWYDYTFSLIFCSCGISIMSMISYFTLLKPEVKVFYSD